MGISKVEFENAFRRTVSSEFSHIPCDESAIDYIFSERFNSRMNKLIKQQRKFYWNYINTTVKRVAVVFVAILTLFTASLSVKAIRQPIISFVVNIYKGFAEYIFGGDTVDKIQKEYVISAIPDEFKQTTVFRSDAAITTVYENETGDSIEFTQGTSKYVGFSVDTEHSVKSKLYVDGVEIEVYEWDYSIYAVWARDTYVFDIMCYSNSIEIEDMEKMILSVQ